MYDQNHEDDIILKQRDSPRSQDISLKFILKVLLCKVGSKFMENIASPKIVSLSDTVGERMLG